MTRRTTNPHTGRHAGLSGPSATLWDVPGYRTSDPDTSRQAAQELADSGQLIGRRLETWQALKDQPGATAGELAQAMGWERGDVSKRLPELVAMGWARRGEPRACRVKGSQMTTWTANAIRNRLMAAA